MKAFEDNLSSLQVLKFVLRLPAVDYLDPSDSQDPPLTTRAAMLSLKEGEGSNLTS